MIPGAGNFARFGGQRSYSFNNMVAGQLTPGDLNRHNGPDIPCETVYIKADPDNTGQIYIGGNNVSATTGFQLGANDPVQYLPITNLNLLWYVCTVSTDRLHYLAFW